MVKPVDTLGVTDETKEFSPGWDWKGDFVSQLKEDGLERFSQYSATPDTTAIYAGPARFSGVAGGGTSTLKPIGLVDGLQFGSNAQLARLYEIGSNRAFFTRGKTMHNLSFGKILADQKNILAALVEQAHTFHDVNINDEGTKAAGADGPDSDIMMNLDSEYLNVPFGLLLVFKTKGSPTGGSNTRGKILSATYLEYCMFQGYNFSVNAQAPVIMENIGLEYDRPVPVAIK